MPQPTLCAPGRRGQTVIGRVTCRAAPSWPHPADRWDSWWNLTEPISLQALNERLFDCQGRRRFDAPDASTAPRLSCGCGSRKTTGTLCMLAQDNHSLTRRIAAGLLTVIYGVSVMPYPLGSPPPRRRRSRIPAMICPPPRGVVFAVLAARPRAPHGRHEGRARAPVRTVGG